MSAFTIANLKELEDSAGKRAPGIEGRFARSHLDSDHLGVSYLRYAPGVRSSIGHSHREQEEAYVILSGSGRIRLDDEIRELRQWDVVRVSPTTIRAHSRPAMRESSSSPSAPTGPRVATASPLRSAGSNPRVTKHGWARHSPHELRAGWRSRPTETEDTIS
jgi:quercetin dioxygenase-like cupin family protein